MLSSSPFDCAQGDQLDALAERVARIDQADKSSKLTGRPFTEAWEKSRD